MTVYSIHSRITCYLSYVLYRNISIRVPRLVFRVNYNSEFSIPGLLASQTAELLQRENVVIFEAAFRHENLIIRTDILGKRGERVQLIEVKTKSFDPVSSLSELGSSVLGRIREMTS